MPALRQATVREPLQGRVLRLLQVLRRVRGANDTAPQAQREDEGRPHGDVRARNPMAKSRRALSSMPFNALRASLRAWHFRDTTRRGGVTLTGRRPTLSVAFPQRTQRWGALPLTKALEKTHVARDVRGNGERKKFPQGDMRS